MAQMNHPRYHGIYGDDYVTIFALVKDKQEGCKAEYGHSL